MPRSDPDGRRTTLDLRRTVNAVCGPVTAEPSEDGTRRRSDGATGLGGATLVGDAGLAEVSGS